jgi:hypothetical protein
MRWFFRSPRAIAWYAASGNSIRAKSGLFNFPRQCRHLRLAEVVIGALKSLSRRYFKTDPSEPKKISAVTEQNPTK